MAAAMLASIATIVLGASFMLLGGMLTVQFASLLRDASPVSPSTRETVVEGLMMETLCGIAAVVLGILSFGGADTTVLLPAAVIVLGAGLLVAGGTWVRLRGSMPSAAEAAAASSAPGGSTIAVAPAPGLLIALAGIVLGIIGLAGSGPIIASLVGLLGLGVGVFFLGTSLAILPARLPGA